MMQLYSSEGYTALGLRWICVHIALCEAAPLVLLKDEILSVNKNDDHFIYEIANASFN